MRIAHIITRMIVGGAQENTLLNCMDLINEYQDDVLLITGPALGPEGNLLETNKGAEALPTELVPMLRRSIHPWRDWSSYRQIKQTLHEFQPDVVHTHSAKGGVIGRMVATSLNVPAIVHTVHGAPFHPYQGRGAREVFRRCEKYAAGKCHRLVSVADAMTDLMVDADVAPREKFQTVYSGMDVEPFLAANDRRDETRKRLGFDESDVVVGKVARLFHLKGHEFLIEAAEQVIDKNPNAKFLLVGDGILKSRYEEQLVEKGIREHFVFTGLVPPSEIPDLMGAMDLLVHTSLREGLARTLPQALISGKPIVSFDVDGAREVCISNETGFLIPPKEIKPLAKAIDTLVSDPNLCRALGGEGRRRFTDRFRHQTMTRQLREIYEQILSGS